MVRNPWLLTEVDGALFDDPRVPPTREAVVEAMAEYAARRRAAGEPVKRVTRHMLGLFQGRPGARAWRRHLSEHAWRPGASERPRYMNSVLYSPTPRAPHSSAEEISSGNSIFASRSTS